jgi:hypothetical protein
MSIDENGSGWTSADAAEEMRGPMHDAPKRSSVVNRSMKKKIPSIPQAIHDVIFRPAHHPLQCHILLPVPVPPPTYFIQPNGPTVTCDALRWTCTGRAPHRADGCSLCTAGRGRAAAGGSTRSARRRWCGADSAAWSRTTGCCPRTAWTARGCTRCTCTPCRGRWRPMRGPSGRPRRRWSSPATRRARTMAALLLLDAAPQPR